MSTVKNVALAGLDYIGVDSLAVASDAQRRALARSLTGAAQEIVSKRPDLFCQAMSGSFSGTRSVSATVTHGSPTIVLAEASGPYAGRTIVLPDSLDTNQILAGTAETVDTGATTCTLRRAYTGTTGTITATLYGDAILLPAGFTKVLGNCELVGYGPLQPLADRAEYIQWSNRTRAGDYGVSRTRNAQRRQQDQPLAWWVETAFLPAGSTQPARTAVVLRLVPLPDRDYTVEFDAAALPTEITVDMLEDAAADVLLPMPGGQSIILEAFFLQRWSVTPWFKNEKARPEIARQFTTAENALINYSPQSETGGRITVGCK